MEKKPKKKLSDDQLKVAKKLKSKLVDDQLKKQLDSSKSKNTKVIVVMVVLLLCTLSIALSYLGGAKKISPPQETDPSLLITYQDLEAFTLPHSQLPSDLQTAQTFTFVAPPKKQPIDGFQEIIDLQIDFMIKYGLPLEVTNDIGMKFRLIPPGQFLMGSPKDEADRSPTEFLHQSSVKNLFYLQKNETTQEQWLEIEETNPAKSVKKDFPIQDISFNDGLLFFEKLNKKYQLSPYTYTYPSEQEWEYACRAGSNTRWHFSKDEELAKKYIISKYSADARYKKDPLLPNAFGLFNMHGNMQEFTRSPFFIYDCEKDQFANTWDFILCDGAVPEKPLTPRKNFNVEDRTKGSQTGIYFHDANHDGIWSNGEIIWSSKNPLRSTYKHGEDYIIWRGDQNLEKDLASFNDKRGIAGNIYYHDKNNNLSWDANEAVWGYNEWKRYKSGYVMARGGSWALELKFSRSAMRFTYSNEDKGSYLGMRALRQLFDIVELPPEQQAKNRHAWEEYLKSTQPK